MTRYGCFEIRTSCGACGQPLPINGPIRHRTCPHCFEQASIKTDDIVGFINDLEKEYDGLGDREGRGGTMMSGGGTYKYGYWRLAPRCKKCKIPLPEVDLETDGSVACTECGKEFAVFPAPDWLKKHVPSAQQCIGADREEAEAQEAAPDDEVKPIGMSCPLCGAGLKIGADAERLSACQYCKGEVHIPDAIWLRLHPVPKVREWWLRLEGKNRAQLDAERRFADQAAEERALKRWKPMPTRSAPPNRFKLLKILGVVALVVIVLVVIILAFALMAAAGMNADQIGDALAVPIAVTVAVAAVIGLLGFRLVNMLQYKAGPIAACKKAMTALAAKYGLEHGGTDYGLGSISGEYQGRDVDINPEDDHAIKIDLDQYPYPFRLETAPPANPGEDLHRFETGDQRFDRTFPIRYCEPDIYERLQESDALLQPIHRFLDRWGDKLARMKIYSEIGVHLAPGGSLGDSNSSARYLYADELEPLFLDTLILAKAIDRVAMGKDPELPGS